VNGELAVSRSFGDGQYKQVGGPAQVDHPVSAGPELATFFCEPSDFLVLVCDGVSEGRFSNGEVVELVAKTLRECNDPGEAARLVCHQAVATDSKDNVTCMVVLCSAAEGERLGKHVQYNPGPLNPNHKAFMTAYKAMAEKGGKTLAEAVEMRYDIIQEKLASADTLEDKRKDLEKELGEIGTPDGEKGSAERATWFRNWESRLAERDQDGPGGGAPVPGQRADLAQLLQTAVASGISPQTLMQMMSQRQAPEDNEEDKRRVKAVELPALQEAVSKCPCLQWDARMEELGGAEGMVKVDDESDGTSKVRFPELGIVAWLPTAALVDINDE